jgi:hypothetical protein
VTAPLTFAPEALDVLLLLLLWDTFGSKVLLLLLWDTFGSKVLLLLLWEMFGSKRLPPSTPRMDGMRTECVQDRLGGPLD